MPHFGLIPNNISDIERLLLRARLHWRGGNIRFSKNQIDDGVAAHYDALISAMYSYALKSEKEHRLDIDKSMNLDDDFVLFNILDDNSVFTSQFSCEDFMFLHQTLELALSDKLSDLDVDKFVSLIEKALKQLDVLPFEENELPSNLAITT